MSASLDAIRILTDTTNLTNAAQALGIPRSRIDNLGYF
jgi:hypothetical protein